MLHLEGFLSIALSTLSNWNAFTERLITPSPTASHPPITDCLSSFHHRLPLVLLLTEVVLPSLIFPVLCAGPSSPNLLFHFRFGQTCSETKTLQILQESFCIHSPAHVWSSPKEALFGFPFFPPCDLSSLWN